MSKLTHFDASGQAHMVDISDKDITERIAIAVARIEMQAETLHLITEGSAKKGDVLGTARLAGIMAAKKTAELIPLCHPLPLSKVAIKMTPNNSGIDIEATVKTTGKTGVEMEALVAAQITALTIYDMVKAADKSMRITDCYLRLKEGGKSGRIENP